MHASDTSICKYLKLVAHCMISYTVGCLPHPWELVGTAARCWELCCFHDSHVAFIWGGLTVSSLSSAIEAAGQPPDPQRPSEAGALPWLWSKHPAPPAPCPLPRGPPSLQPWSKHSANPLMLPSLSGSPPGLGDSVMLRELGATILWPWGLPSLWWTDG